MKVLITGGAGFIGSHLVRRLLANGDEPVSVDNLSTGLRENLPEEVRLIVMDVHDAEFLPLCRKAQFDAAVHLAGQTMVNSSIEDPMNDAKENILGGIQVLEAAKCCGMKRVIFASTAAAYGDVAEDDLPVRESQKPCPMSFYGLSKVTMEHYLKLYHEICGLEYVILRFANVFGERQGDSGEGGVISIFTKRIAEGKDITIYGDGEQTRDFVYAGDVASGIVAALHTKNTNTVYNLSTRTETSIRQLVTHLSHIAGRRIVPNYAAPRPGDIYRSMLDNLRAYRGLGWKPETGLEEALRRTYEHFTE